LALNIAVSFGWGSQLSGAKVLQLSYNYFALPFGKDARISLALIFKKKSPTDQGGTVGQRVLWVLL